MEEEGGESCTVSLKTRGMHLRVKLVQHLFTHIRSLNNAFKQI